MILDPGHPKLAAAPLVRQPVRFGGETPETRRAPMLGEHTDGVLRDVLGLGADEIESLRRDRVV
jgi:succinate--hydroxymethylglutarate CoA-transferase